MKKLICLILAYACAGNPAFAFEPTPTQVFEAYTQEMAKQKAQAEACSQPEPKAKELCQLEHWREYAKLLKLRTQYDMKNTPANEQE